MTVLEADLKPGDIILIADIHGDNLFEVLSDPDDVSKVRYDPIFRIAVRCFFSSPSFHFYSVRDAPYWFSTEYITKVFRK